LIVNVVYALILVRALTSSVYLVSKTTSPKAF